MVSYHEVYAGLWIALLVLGVERFPREYGEARMLSALTRYKQLRGMDPWVAEWLPELEDTLAGAEDAFKSALAWGHTAGFCREDIVAGEVLIEIEEDLYRNALSHFGPEGPDFHRVMLEFAKAFSGGLKTIWDV